MLVRVSLVSASHKIDASLCGGVRPSPRFVSAPYGCADRLASLGQLAASVALEISDPVSGVLNLFMLLERMMARVPIRRGGRRNFRKYFGLISAVTPPVVLPTAHCMMSFVHGAGGAVAPPATRRMRSVPSPFPDLRVRRDLASITQDGCGRGSRPGSCRSIQW
jgi:hypothetical protein